MDIAVEAALNRAEIRLQMFSFGAGDGAFTPTRLHQQSRAAFVSFFLHGPQYPVTILGNKRHAANFENSLI